MIESNGLTGDCQLRLKAENLQQLGVSVIEAQKTEGLGRLLVSRGYCYLDDENARLYVNAFRRASINKEYQYWASENVSGQEYISNFENIPMQMTTVNKGDRYLKMPSEIDQKREGLFSKIKNYFKKIFNKSDVKLLPEGNPRSYSEDKDPYKIFREQYESKGVIIGAEQGKVQQLDDIVRNNYNDGFEIVDE